MIYLFVLGDSLTRIEQLTKCCESLQKVRVRLGPCKIDLGPQKFYITDRSNAMILLWFYLFYVFGVDLFCCLNLM